MNEPDSHSWQALLERQKRELSTLLEEVYVERSELKEAKTLLSSPLAKVVLGPRRAGKSVFALQLCKDLKPAYCNFDDDQLLKLVDRHGSDRLLEEFDKCYGDTKYILFDEIQNLEKWELIVNKLLRRKKNLVITGSNANLLSQELATHLTGRYHEIRILPFSWHEYQSTLKDSASINDYMARGGYPEVLRYAIPHTSYLSQLSESIILKDIVKRYKIRQPTKIYELWEYLRSEFTRQHSITSLASALNFPSKTTTQNYYRYLQSVYLVLELARYSFKSREQLSAPKKTYLVDTGFVKDTESVLPTQGRRLENAVFLGILRWLNKTGGKVFYYRTKQDYEVDFMVKEGPAVTELIQACYSIEKADTTERELRALFAASKELQCKRLTLVTMGKTTQTQQSQEINEQGMTVRIERLEEFLGRGDK